jgi:nucleoside 2-deoxyribosyltransferase
VQHLRAIRIYLAGPDVFLPDFGKTVFDAKKAMCRQFGFEGVSPMDGAPDLAGLEPFAQGLAIYRANLAHMDSCEGVIANMTPFRGISMDAGTAFEMGYMAAQGKFVLGYTHVTEPYAERSERYDRAGTRDRIDHYASGTSIERFDMADNLMMVGAVYACGWQVEQSDVVTGEELTSLTGFKACLTQLAARTGA